MKKIAVLMLILIMSALCFPACGKDGGDLEPALPPGYTEMVRDRKFASGLNLLGLEKNDPQYNSVKTYVLGGNAVSPIWNIMQWGTKFDLRSSEVALTGGKYVLEDSSKKISAVKGGSEFALRVKAQNVFAKPRVHFEDWPHLYLEQNFSELKQMGTLDSMVMDIEYTLTYFQDYMTPAEYDPGLHSAQFQWILTLINKEKFYGAMNDFLWFNVALYDQREDITKDFYLQDGGKEDATDKFIFSKGMEGVSDQKPKDGERIHISVDILPELKKAFDLAQQNGFLRNCVYDLMQVNYMNIGWEVTGTFDAEVTVHRMSLSYKLA